MVDGMRKTKDILGIRMWLPSFMVINIDFEFFGYDVSMLKRVPYTAKPMYMAFIISLGITDFR